MPPRDDHSTGSDHAATNPAQPSRNTSQDYTGLPTLPPQIRRDSLRTYGDLPFHPPQSQASGSRGGVLTPRYPQYSTYNAPASVSLTAQSGYHAPFNYRRHPYPPPPGNLQRNVVPPNRSFEPQPNSRSDMSEPPLTGRSRSGYEASSRYGNLAEPLAQSAHPKRRRGVTQSRTKSKVRSPVSLTPYIPPNFEAPTCDGDATRSMTADLWETCDKTAKERDDATQKLALSLSLIEIAQCAKHDSVFGAAGAIQSFLECKHYQISSVIIPQVKR